MFGNLVVSMLVRSCGDGPAGRADLIRLQVNQLRGVLQVMNHRNMLEAQELRALIQRNERMRIVNQNTPCEGARARLQPSATRDLSAGWGHLQRAKKVRPHMQGMLSEA